MSDPTHNQRPAFELQTERLELRPLRESDESLYCELYGDAQTMRFIGPALSLARATRSFQKTLAATRRHPVERLMLAVIDKAAQQAVGICGVHQFDMPRRRAEVGIMLKPLSHTRGFAKECYRALITRAFATFPLDEIWSRIAVDHYVAERVLVGVGFSPSDTPESPNACPGHRVWSAYRESWTHKATAG